MISKYDFHPQVRQKTRRTGENLLLCTSPENIRTVWFCLPSYQLELVALLRGGITARGEPVLRSSRWLEWSLLPWAMSLAVVGWTGVPAQRALPFLFPISSFSLSRPSHPSCINWVWCWNPPLTAHAHVQPPAVKTSMFSATIMIIAAEHSAKGISKSD